MHILDAILIQHARLSSQYVTSIIQIFRSAATYDQNKAKYARADPPKISQRLSGYGISSRLNKIRKLVVKGELKKLNLIVPDKNEE